MLTFGVRLPQLSLPVKIAPKRLKTEPALTRDTEIRGVAVHHHLHRHQQRRRYLPHRPHLRSGRSGAPCELPSDPLLSMKQQQQIMADGPRCKRRKQANPRRKNGKYSS
ncbi:zinc finger E-box-binding homeobox 2 isoform X2 [Arapaima gigas]